METSTRKCNTGQSSQIDEFISLLHPAGSVFEIRSLNCPSGSDGRFPSTHSGYFTDAVRAHELALLLDLVNKPAGIYITLNPVNPSLLARANHQIKSKARATTSDLDVVSRQLFVLDIDVTRPAGISSTDAEMVAATTLAYQIRDELAADGWPDAILCMSGNGAYLLYRIDLPNDDAATDLVKRVLHGLAARYNTDQLEIDLSTFNAARIIKLIGTTARKGDDVRDIPGIEDRPHRQTWYEPPSGVVNVVPTDLLEAVAASQGQPSGSQSPATTHNHTTSGNAFERYRNYIAKCPDSVSGSNGSDTMLRVACEGFRFGLTDSQVQDGVNEFNATKTAGEKWNTWQIAHKITDAREKVHAAGEWGCRLTAPHCDPGTRNNTAPAIPAIPVDPADFPLAPGSQVSPRDRGNIGTVVIDNGRTVVLRFVSPDGNEATKEFAKVHLTHPDGKPVIPGPRKTLEVIPAREFAEKDFRPTWIIKQVLVAKQSVVCGGRSKAMKTSLLIDAAVSIATGTRFLGEFPTTRATVAMLSGESGAFTIQETAKRIARHRNVDLADADLYFGFTLPQITRWEDVEATAAMMQDTKADVLIVDPAYLCLLGGESTGRQASNVFDMGPLLLRLSGVGQQTDSTVILCHHCRKSPTEGRDRYDPPELEDLAMAGFSEWARQWWLVGRRERFEPGTGDHKLWLNVGGSVGMSGTWSVDIDEGVLADDFTGRHWDVTVGSVDQARNEKKQRLEEKKSEEREQVEFEHCQKIIKILRFQKNGSSRTKIRDDTGIKMPAIRDALLTLKQRQEVVEVEGKSGRQTCQLFFLTEYAPTKPQAVQAVPGSTPSSTSTASAGSI